MRRKESCFRWNKIWKSILLALFLILLPEIQNQKKTEVFAQSSLEGEETAEEEKPAELPKPPPLLPEDIVLSGQPNENGWFCQDTVFTISLPEDWDYGDSVPFVEYRKLGEEEWKALETDPEGTLQFRFTESDGFYDGAYQFRTGFADGCVMPEKDWVTVPFRKDGEAPVLTVECPEPAWEVNGKKYYGDARKESEEVLLVFTENSWGSQKEEDGPEPSLEILKNGKLLGEEETGQWISWSAAEEGTLYARVQLPYEAGSEAVYQIRAAYRDPAGNPLCAAPDNFGRMEDAENGVFLTGALVLDARAPELLSFTAEGDFVDWTAGDGGVLPLYKNVEGEDIVFTFAMEDGEKEWAENTVRIQVWNLKEERIVEDLTGDSEAVSWTHEGSRHTAVFGFDGEEGKEGVYQLQLKYRDRVGHPLKDGRENAGEGFLAEVREEEGLCLSGPFIIDHAAPVLGAAYSEAVRLVKDGRDYEDSKTPVPGYVSYYNTDIQAVFTVRDNYAVLLEDDCPENFRLFLTKEGEDLEAAVQDVTSEILWTRSESLLTGTCQISEEGDYRLCAVYEDKAGNPAEAGELDSSLVQGTLRDGRYESPLLVLDKTAPVISMNYSREPSGFLEERKYFREAVSLCVTVTDRNFRVKELKDILLEFEAQDSGGKDCRESTALLEFLEGLDSAEISRSSWSAKLPLCTEANYCIPAGLTDLAGNAAVWEDGEQREIRLEYPVIDYTPPENLILEYPGGKAVNYQPSGWIFAMEQLDLKASAEDMVSGIREIRFECAAEDGEKTVRTQKFEPVSKGNFEVELPDGGEDFKGQIDIVLYDHAGNCLRQSWNCVVESRERHRESGGVRLTAQTQPSRTVDGIDYYNTDVSVLLEVWDTCSGLGSFRYSGGNTLSGGRDYGAEAGSILGTVPERELTCEYSQELQLEAVSNNENDIQVTAEYTDNAGYTESTEQRYHIDVTPPEVSVEYDLNEPRNGRYYNQARTATVTIRERNFDERDVEFRITNTERAMPEISGWTSTGSGDDALHVCQVIFRADGDYTFSVGFQDLAGNQADYGRTDEFTIDRTAPVLSVDWDNQDSRNEFYYADSRTARLTILEKNFKGELAEIIVTAQGDAKEIPAVSGWTREGDRNTAVVRFLEDGMYTLSVEGEDLAGNRFTAYETGIFVIDQTPPELEIFGVQARSANSGEVCPSIRYTDTNCGQERAEILLSGYQNGEKECRGAWTPLEKGMEFQMEDFAYEKEADDMYTLEASVRDLAGNESRRKLTFSVNRFGSVYTFDAGTEALAGKEGRFYTNQEQDIVVTETNVDTLEFHEIICSRNGKLHTLQEGQDYTVQESRSPFEWKQYTYRIGKDCFAEEGRYLLSIYSEDRAENASETGMKGKKIEFVVDKTAPDILVSGVEDGGRYREGIREVALDIQDNLRLEGVKICLSGQETTVSASELAEKEGRISVEIQGADHWQELTVTAWDAAGNRAQTETFRLLVTPDFWIQLVMNRAACYSIAGVLLAFLGIAALALHAWARRRGE